MEPSVPRVLLTARDAATVAHVSHTTILRWSKSGRLRIEARTPNAVILFTREDVLAAVDQKAAA